MKIATESQTIPSFKRRRFIKMLGGGVAVLVFHQRSDAQQRGRRGGGGEKPKELSAWLHIAEDASVQVFTGKAEVGQNIRTSLAMVVAEELKVPLASVRLVMADTDLVPWDAGTFGSRTTPDMASHLRRAAATAREALIELAAAEWNIDREKLEAADGHVRLRDGERSISYAALSKGQELVATIDDQVPTTAAANWKIAGSDAPKADGQSFVTGAHLYSSDIHRPEMLHGKVLRAPAFGAKLKSADLSAAASIPGVHVHREGDFIGVTASKPDLAGMALVAIRAEWQGGGGISNKELFDHLKPSGSRESLEAGLRAATHRMAQTYTVEYIAHAPLEPRAAVAEWTDGKLTVWTGSQRPFGVKDELMREFSLPPDKVRVIVPDTGSGFGGKHSGECAVEAAQLAKAAGKPVKLVWTRKEEFTWAYFRPAGVMDLKAGIDDNGRLVAWEHHTYNPGGAAIESPYQIAKRLIESHGSDSPLRQGSYRGLGAVANCFARESLMDELAHAVNIDPLEFRLKNLTNTRLRAVLEAATGQFGWKARKDGDGRGCGLACGIDKGGHLATCAEVEVKDGKPVLKRITAAFECGAILNPRHLKLQVEGAIIMGLGGALFEKIEFKDGRILNSAFSKYRVPRFSDIPPIEIILLDRKDLPSAGAGEAPILGIAPAIGNAIFAATGTRHRALPMI